MEIVLKSRDTITDFVEYLTKKEKLITSGQLRSANGEEDLLACYLNQLDSSYRHNFVTPTTNFKIAVPENLWNNFVKSPGPAHLNLGVFSSQPVFGW